MRKVTAFILVVVLAFTAMACNPPPGSEEAMVSTDSTLPSTTATELSRVVEDHRVDALKSSSHPTTTTTAPPPPTTVPPTTTTPPTTAAPTTTTAPPAPPPTVSSGNVHCGGWGDLVATYFPGEVATGCRVLLCESNGNPSASSPTNDHGLMQIHAGSSSWPGGWQQEFQRVTGASFFNGVYDPNLNMKMARHIKNVQGWGAWACY